MPGCWKTSELSVADGNSRAQVMAGNEEGAGKSYHDLLTLWKDADPDIPKGGVRKGAIVESRRLDQTVNTVKG
jgi:hypothetical protein